MLIFPITTDAQPVIGPPQGQWTAMHWETLPDDGNCYEIIGGVLYMSTSPSLFHNWIVRRLDYFVGHPSEERGLAFAFLERVGVFMPGCEPVQPDFVIVLAKNAAIIRERRIYGVPDLLVEVLSPGSAAYDEDVKLRAYAQAAVPEYAVVDPAVRQVRRYLLAAPGRYAAPQVYQADDTLAFTCLPTLPFVVGKLFEGAPDTTP